MTGKMDRNNDFDKGRLALELPGEMHEAISPTCRVLLGHSGVRSPGCRFCRGQGEGGLSLRQVVVPYQTLHGNLPLSFRQGGVPEFPLSEQHGRELRLSHR